MWELFLSTGNIDAYLAYRACSDCQSNNQQLADEATETPVKPEYFVNHLLSEVRWQ